ncbi:uncharacterized protein G2W53_012538 [Senna tora]|uniref:Uncharacterized protein n=1 Tax=Senna tora TaxID=362788 RepID=A0A834TX37_9FABA|nr:uncharacterized protein G2W53_012538 [Senna tora]
MKQPVWRADMLKLQQFEASPLTGKGSSGAAGFRVGFLGKRVFVLTAESKTAEALPNSPISSSPLSPSSKKSSRALLANIRAINQKRAESRDKKAPPPRSPVLAVGHS